MENPQNPIQHKITQSAAEFAGLVKLYDDDDNEALYNFDQKQAQDILMAFMLKYRDNLSLNDLDLITDINDLTANNETIKEVSFRLWHTKVDDLKSQKISIPESTIEAETPVHLSEDYDRLFRPEKATLRSLARKVLSLLGLKSQ